MSITIEQYIDKYNPCQESIEWARSTGCTTMQELFVHPEMKYEYATAIAGRMLSYHDLRLFACWCVRQVWHLLEDRSKRAVEVAERYAIGEATDEELSLAHANAAAAAVAAYAYADAAYAYAANAAAYDAYAYAAAAAAYAADAVVAANAAAAYAYAAYAYAADAYAAAAGTATVRAEQLKKLQTYTLTDEMR